MRDSRDRDVVVIGSGPIGLACAVEAGWRDLSCLVLEKGCLLQSIVDFPQTMTFFSTSDRLEIGDIPFVSHGAKATRAEALEYYRRVREHWGLEVRTYEEVTAVTGSRGRFRIDTTRGAYGAQAVIVATGFYSCPNMMGVDGEDLPKVSHYYREPWPYAGQKLLVVGGGNSAADAALECRRKGAEVTLVSRDAGLDRSLKYWVRPDIENRIAEGSIRAFFGSTVSAIREDEVVLDTPGGREVVENDFVLALTGYHPDYDFLDRLGVECADDPGREPRFDRESYESNVPGIYLAGVVCCGMRAGTWLIENSRAHAPAIFDHLEATLFRV